MVLVVVWIFVEGKVIEPRTTPMTNEATAIAVRETITDRFIVCLSVKPRILLRSTVQNRIDSSYDFRFLLDSGRRGPILGSVIRFDYPLEHGRLFSDCWLAEERCHFCLLARNHPAKTSITQAPTTKIIRKIQLSGSFPSLIL